MIDYMHINMEAYFSWRLYSHIMPRGELRYSIVFRIKPWSPHIACNRTDQHGLSNAGANMKGFRVFILLLNLMIIQQVYCDIYLHNPRGSNDRLNGQNTNRQNANRLFDSQVCKAIHVL